MLRRSATVEAARHQAAHHQMCRPHTPTPTLPQIESKTVHKRELLAADEERRLQHLESKVTGKWGGGRELWMAGGHCRRASGLVAGVRTCRRPTPTYLLPCMTAHAAKERALAEQQEQLLQARADAERKLDGVAARLRAVAERERELEQRQEQLMQQVGSEATGGSWTVGGTVRMMRLCCCVQYC